MSTPYLGQLALVGFNFAPIGWQLAAGQTLPISQYTALFSLLGTMYGGNGTSNFQLPNLQGNVAIGFGQGPGLSNYVQGQTGGSQNVTLLASQTPSHTHSLETSSAKANQQVPAGHVLGNARQAGGDLYAAVTTPASPMSPNAVSSFGSGLPHNNMMPYLGMYWIIAFNGIYPSRS
jgi:microcystin-dependent protein